MATPSLTPDELLRTTLAAVAPGGELRDGLERILRGRTGALVVLGFAAAVVPVGAVAPGEVPAGLRLLEARDLQHAVELSLAPARRGAPDPLR